LRIFWEHDENTSKTRQKNKKYPFPTPFPQKRKKLDQISLSKTVHDHFSPGLIPLPKSWGTYREKGINHVVIIIGVTKQLTLKTKEYNCTEYNWNMPLFVPHPQYSLVKGKRIVHFALSTRLRMEYNYYCKEPFTLFE